MKISYEIEFVFWIAILYNDVIAMDGLSIGFQFPVHFLKERESDYKSVLLIGWAYKYTALVGCCA